MIKYVLCLTFIACPVLAHEGEVHTYFKSIEHQWLGNIALLDFPGSDGVKATEHKLRLPNGNSLSYGDIIALGGDYYGVPDSPISDGTTDADRLARFQAAFNDLALEQKASNCEDDYCANKLLEIFKGEADAHKQQGENSEVPARTAGAMFSITMYTSNNYLKLAIRNWDHFLPTSMVAYETGHSAAIAQAIKAKKMATPKQRLEGLELAFAMNAFSDHFLTDMFSSGHIRVPRRQIFEQTSVASMAGLLAGQMHDEDGRVGLTVKNAEGKSWHMFGDGMLFIPGAEENRKMVARAVQTSIGEVINAFKTGKAATKDEFGIKKLVAQLDDDLLHPKDDKLNSSPLYTLDAKGVVVARTPENSLCSYEWTLEWSGLSQLVGYSAAGDGSDCKFNPK